MERVNFINDKLNLFRRLQCILKIKGTIGLFMTKRNTYLIYKEGKTFKIYKNVDVTTHTKNILNDFSGLEN